jgi:hypothetical protein
MARQHAVPIFLPTDGSAARELVPLALAAGPDAVSEATIQQLIFNHPACLPIREIDPLFCNPVALCMEMNTPAGSIDILMVTASGLPVLVECKLWRNPEGRREVVGQILDYAKELSRWSSSDLQREVSRRLKRDGNPIIDLVRSAGHEIDEVEFNDALTLNLRRGRFLLLIVGDGIREGVEAITEYLQAHAGLHFTLGLVEMPIFEMPGASGRIVAPRVLARTQVVTRTVIAMPPEMTLREDVDPDLDSEIDEMTADRVAFWKQFVAGLTFDDPDQPLPKVSKQGYVYVGMPAPSGSCWLTVFRNVAAGKVGVFLSYTRETIGEQATRRVVAESWVEVREELSGTVELVVDRLGRDLISDSHTFGNLGDAEKRRAAITWLQVRTNDFVNAFRPRIRSAVGEITGVI